GAQRSHSRQPGAIYLVSSPRLPNASAWRPLLRKSQTSITSTKAEPVLLRLRSPSFVATLQLLNPPG
ncbi:hypothetical protein LPJ57_007320, partial [Coemansia sp. RSA 486]